LIALTAMPPAAAEVSRKIHGMPEYAFQSESANNGAMKRVA